MSGEQIWKYTLGGHETTIGLPAGAKVLTVQIQHDMPTLWVHVDPTNRNEDRVFIGVGTGHTMPDANYRYISTVQDGAGFVWHFFEVLS